MGTEFMYSVLIALVLIMKICFVLITIVHVIAEQRKWDPSKVRFLEVLKEESLVASEVFMYIVLMVIFFPRNKVEDIRVGREEQLIFFILGLLGLLHTNWEKAKYFFIHAGDIITGK